MLNNPLGGGAVKGLLVTKLPQIKSYAFIADYFIQNDRKLLIKEKMMVKE